MKTFRKFRQDEKLKEDEGGAAPTNSAGTGNIAGIGVGPEGEPGVPKKKLRLQNGPPVDPRMFSDKIFSRTPKEG